MSNTAFWPRPWEVRTTRTLGSTTPTRTPPTRSTEVCKTRRQRREMGKPLQELLKPLNSPALTRDGMISVVFTASGPLVYRCTY
jgi:hypothetical protein